jgi:16S rRNA processing protein RimM
MKQPGHNCISIGRLAKTHGYKGAIKIELQNNITLNKPNGTKEPVFLEINQKPVPFFYTHWEGMNNMPIVQFEDITDEEKAKKLIGLTVLVPKTWVEVDDSVSVADLINFTVVDEVHGKLGFINNYMETPAQTLLYMLQNGRETMIPFVDEFIIEIDWDNQTIYTHLPDGLLDL